MKCVFCNHDFEINPDEVHVFCPNCQSYYKQIHSTTDYLEYVGYPEKFYRKKFEITRVRVTQS